MGWRHEDLKHAVLAGTNWVDWLSGLCVIGTNASTAWKSYESPDSTERVE